MPRNYLQSKQMSRQRRGRGMLRSPLMNRGNMHGMGWQEDTANWFNERGRDTQKWGEQAGKDINKAIYDTQKWGEQAGRDIDQFAIQHTGKNVGQLAQMAQLDKPSTYTGALASLLGATGVGAPLAAGLGTATAGLKAMGAGIKQKKKKGGYLFDDVMNFVSPVNAFIPKELREARHQQMGFGVKKSSRPLKLKLR